MYSQSNSNQSSVVGVEKHLNMDLVTRRTKRRSILGKGRSSLRLSVAGIIPPVGSETNGVEKNKVAGGARKPIADDVLRHFARTNGINPLNPFASQLKESIGSGSLDENDQEASCSAPSSSSEGSARKEDPDITGVFFMDDVESVKKRQLDAAITSSNKGSGEKGSGAHTVSCNLMTRSPFAKQPLKDQALRLNRAAESRALNIRSKGGLTSSSSKRRTVDPQMVAALSADRAPIEYSNSRQSVLSPVAPVLKSCESEKSVKSSALSLSLSSSVSLHSGYSSLPGAENGDYASSLRRSLSTADLANCISASGCSRDARRAASEMHFEEMCKVRCESLLPTNMADDFFASKRNQTTVQLSDRPIDQLKERTTDHQPETKTHCTTDSSRSKERYSVASYSSDDIILQHNTKKSRPSIMSDLIINNNSKNHGVSNINDLSSKKENSVPIRSKYIDDLLKRIDLTVKTAKHNDDTSSKPDENRENIDCSTSKFENGGSVLKSKVNIDSSSSSKLVYDDRKNGREDCSQKEVCNKFNRTLVFDDDDGDNVDDDDKTFIYNESVCNKTLLVAEYERAGKIKKLSNIEEEELRSSMSSANGDASLLESTIRGDHVSIGSSEFGGKVNEKVATILEYLLESNKEFHKKRNEFLEGLKQEQKEFVRLQNKRIETFERFANSFSQEQTDKLAAMCEDVANLTAGNTSSTVDDEVFHTAQKRPLTNGESNPNNSIVNDSNAIYSQLKSDFKCLKTPNAHSNKKAQNLNRTILTPHSMSVCVQEQVSMLFDGLD